MKRKSLGNKSAISFLIILLILLLVISGASSASVIWKLLRKPRTRTVTFYSTSNDGYLFNWGYFDYERIRGAQTPEIGGVATRSIMIGQSDASQLCEYWIFRGAVFFDTSSLPDKSKIVSATLSLYGCPPRYGLSTLYPVINFSIVIQSGAPIYPHEPMEPGDYYMGHYSGNGGMFHTSNFTITGYNDIPLNDQGMAWINKRSATKFCLRSDREINGEKPVGWGEVVALASEEGSGYQPKLEVTYRIW